MIVVRVRPSAIAVACALRFGPEPCRLMGIQTRFPDLGHPMPEKVGFLRYPGEAILGDAEPAATSSTSNHLNDRSIENG